MEVTGRRLDMEEELVLFCEPCEVENSKSSADGACRECKEYMCNSCFKHHLKSKHSRKHVLLSLDKFSLLTLDSGSEDVTKCEKHDNENIKFYCRLHEIVGCGDCIVLGHTTCKPEYIKELSKTFIDGDIYKAIVKRFEDIGKLKSDYEKEIEENKGGIEKMTETALNEIRHFRTEINNCLDKAEANILSKVQTLSKEYAVLLEEIENDLKLVSSELEEVQRMINTKLHSENAFFIKVVDSKCKLSDLIECMFKIMAKNKRLKRFEFVKNDQISKLLKTSELLGILQTETGFSQQPKTSTTAGTVVKYNPPQAKDIMLWNGVTENINTVHKCITAMKEYEGKSLEELRWEDYAAGRKGKHGGESSEDTKEEPEGMESGNMDQFERMMPLERKTKILISDLSSDVHAEYIKEFFENKQKFKGCSVSNVKMDDDGTSAIVEFYEPEAVDIVLSECPLQIMEKEVGISIFRSAQYNGQLLRMKHFKNNALNRYISDSLYQIWKLCNLPVRRDLG